MLDFDYLCDREPSVIAFINPQAGSWLHKLFYGDKEILIPSYPDFSSIKKSPNLTTMLNYASHRSATKATIDAMESKLFKNIVMIAEGIPERETREIIALNKKYKLKIIWPATVWAMTWWQFRVWNTWWSLDNIIESKLYKSWSVWFISKSWWMSNEMRRVIANTTNWSHTSIAVWWDRFTVMTLQEALLEYESIKEIKMTVLLWEIGGTDELVIAEMIRTKKIKKPVVAYCIGTVDDKIKTEVQFWHAWAKALKEQESASYKNTELKKAWAIVPKTFNDFPKVIKQTFKKLNILQKDSWSDLSDRISKIQNRKPTRITSTISDERGEELLYNSKPISDYVWNGSIANVIWNLWLKRDLPKYALDFINTVVILVADHGPAVSGATNSIVTARAWKDVVSSLIAWLSTIGPRFWWAIDGAWKYFLEAVAEWKTPEDFISDMKQKWVKIPGIWHRVKSKFNPDKRCEILANLSKKFPCKKHYLFAKEVEKLTLDKKPNLILNVDGHIGVMLLDILTDLWMWENDIDDYIEAGLFNSFFILARSIGFMGHIIDQKRLKEWLYRTPWEDILYEEE